MEELALADIVELPFIERDVLRAIYERCDLLLLTSDREGYGLPVLEAFAAGKPVVASGVPELAGVGPDVVLADGTAEFVGAVEEALERDTDADRARRQELAARNSWETRTDRLLGLVAKELDARSLAA